MILLTVREISRQFDAEPVFRGVSFDVRGGERIGLVGPNGTGKTTLLRIIAGLDYADSGEVQQQSSAEVALLEQEADFPAGRTLIDEAKSGLAHLYRLQADATEAAERIAGESDSAQLQRLHQRYDRLQEELHRLDAYNIDHRVDEVLTGLGFTEEEFNRPMTSFSGGEQSRALLARMLLRQPSVMLLDEPTNHLDIAATEWLESYLARSGQAMLIVSHDRYFLDRVTNRTLELHAGRLTDYPGNFSAYWKLREERGKVQRRSYDKQQEEIARTEEFIRRNKSAQKHAQATDREKKLARMERIELVENFASASMDFGQPSRSGDWVIDAVGVEKSFQMPLIRDFTYRVHRGDRIGILGPNGSGKTTLLRILLKELQPDSGTVRHGTGVKIGYFDQQLESIPHDVDAVEAVRPPGVPDVTPGQLRNLLARFGIRGDLALQKVGRMSGGERNRVALAKIATQNVNLLVLDEPTNHLDLWARVSLEEALNAFEGTLLFVSHDRYFIDRVARTVIVLEADRWRFYEGNYSDYAAFLDSKSRDSTGVGVAEPPGSTAVGQPPGVGNNRSRNDDKPRRKRKFPYRKIHDIEEDIAGNEQRLEDLEAVLGDPANHGNGRRLKQVVNEFDETKARLQSLYEHWEEAHELN